MIGYGTVSVFGGDDQHGKVLGSDIDSCTSRNVRVAPPTGTPDEKYNNACSTYIMRYRSHVPCFRAVLSSVCSTELGRVMGTCQHTCSNIHSLPRVNGTVKNGIETKTNCFGTELSAAVVSMSQYWTCVRESTRPQNVLRVFTVLYCTLWNIHSSGEWEILSCRKTTREWNTGRQ